jgi:hypothetical protein
MIMFLINGTYMLISPHAYFRLPRWIRQGPLTEKQYGSGWGAVSLRLTGACLLAVSLWMCYEVAVALASGRYAN